MTAKNKRKVPGYIQAGSRYLSQAFLIGILTAVFAFGVLYMTALHPVVVRTWYAYQKLPEFQIDSPYLAGFTGRARLLLADSSLLYEGQLNDAVVSGEGKLFRDGALLYEGGFLENKYNGQGTLYTQDGAAAYTGGFAENLFHGKGTLYFEEGGSQYTYDGAFEAGERSGVGKLFRDGSLVYAGGFAGGLFEGAGEAYEEGSLVYEGSFSAGLYAGDGKLYHDNTLVYEGGFTDGLRNGAGKEFSGGQLLYDGAFSLGAYGGEGSLYDGNGYLIYTGGFRGGVYEGDGKLYDTAGFLLYEGGFSEGLYGGEGKLYRKGSLVYEGGLSGGLYDGEGTEYNPDTGHPVFQGRYLAGARMEAGVLFDENGEPVIVPASRLDPLTLLNAAYDEMLTALIRDGIVYKEQALEEQHLVIDDASAVLYVFRPDTADAVGRLDEIYLCGLSAAGGFVVGGEIGLSYGTPDALLGQADVFALKLSDAYWNRETNASALASLVLQNGSHSITAIYERGEDGGERIAWLKVSLEESYDIPIKK